VDRKRDPSKQGSNAVGRESAKVLAPKANRSPMPRPGRISVSLAIGVLKGVDHGSQAVSKLLVNTLKSQHPELVGFLGRCRIEGHDVHTLRCDGLILDHFVPGAKTPSDRFESARKLINGDPSIEQVLVFSSHFLVICFDGTSKEVR
jgi:hypothetical protein